MAIDIDKIYKSTWDHYLRAKGAMTEESASFEHFDSAISDAIQVLRQINLNLDHLIRKIMQFCLLI